MLFSASIWRRFPIKTINVFLLGAAKCFYIIPNLSAWIRLVCSECPRGRLRPSNRDSNCARGTGWVSRTIRPIFWSSSSSPSGSSFEHSFASLALKCNRVLECKHCQRTVGPNGADNNVLRTNLTYGLKESQNLGPNCQIHLNGNH